MGSDNQQINGKGSGPGKQFAVEVTLCAIWFMKAVSLLLAALRTGAISRAIGVLVLLCFCGSAHAVTYSLPAAFGTSPFSNCSGSAGNYTCSGSVALASSVTLNVTGPLTLNVTGAFSAGNNLTITNTGGFSFVAAGPATFGTSTIITGNLTAASLSFGSGSAVTGTCSPSNPVCTSVTAPTATTVAASAISATGATLNGTISSNGASTTVTFNYGLTTGYGTNATASQSPLAANASGTSVSAVVTGLTCNTTYNFRVSGSNSAGTVNGSNLSFTTLPCVPTVTTVAASAISLTGATLNGTISSNGASTTVTFNYGLTTGYGTNATASQSPLLSSASNVAVSTTLSGLTCGTTYNFRVSATNSAGTSNGNNLVFTTLACQPTVEYKLNECSWNGTPGEVTDSYGVASGAAANGATTAGITPITSSPIRPDRYGNFVVSASQYVALPDVTNLTPNGNFTVTFWAKVNGSAGTYRSPLSLRYYNSVTVTKYGFNVYADTNNNWSFWLGNGPSFLSLTGSSVSNGTWTFIAIRYTTSSISGNTWSGTADLFVNGTQYTSSLKYLPIPASVTNPGLFIGAGGDNATSPTYFFDGQVDEVKLFNASLTNAAITSIYNNEKSNLNWDGSANPTIICPNNPFADWHMDESSWNGTAGEVIDSSGNGYNGTSLLAYGSSAPASTASTTPAYTSGNQSTCSYGVFDQSTSPVHSYTYIGLPSSFPNLNADFTLTAWIRSYDVTRIGQRVFIDDDNDNGWSLSLGDAGPGQLRLYNRNLTFSNPSGGSVNLSVALDTPAIITNGVWYFVAASVNPTLKTVNIFVYNASGTLLANSSASINSSAWCTSGQCTGTSAIGGITAASAEDPSTYHFFGNIDEVRMFNGAFSQSAVAALLPRVRTCPVTGPDHYEISLPTASLTCQSSAVTITACADTSSPCTNPSTAVSGTTATLAASAGTLAATTVTFNASGVAQTTLSNTTAANNTNVTVTLSAAQASVNPTKCCPNGSSCIVANSCSTTFNSAGFLVSAPNHFSCTAQTLSLQAVQSNATNNACVPAFAGVNRNITLYSGYANPTSGTSTASLNYVTSAGGASSTINSLSTIAASPSTLTNLYFNSTGTASITNFVYPDVGQIAIYPVYTGSVTTGDSGLTLSAVSGNTFVVAPNSFGFSSIPAAPLTAGVPFNVSVSAYNACSTPTVTPNFGKESTPANVTLSSGNYVPAQGNATAVNQVLSGFNNGVASTNITWREVGTFDLTATSANYLGSVLSPTGTQAAVGRFKPAYFDTVVTPACTSFTYSGQPFSAIVTAYASGGNITLNYAGASWAKLVTLSDGSNSPAGTISNNTITASNFSSGTATTTIPTYTFSNKATAPTTIIVRATDTDNVSSQGYTEGTSKTESGRLQFSNAYGSDRSNIQMSLNAQYWNGAAWVLNNADSCTNIPANAFAEYWIKGQYGSLINPPGSLSSNISVAKAVTISNGVGTSVGSSVNGNCAGTTPNNYLCVTCPYATCPTSSKSTLTGSVNFAINLGSTTSDASCLPTNSNVVTPLPNSTGAGLPWLKSKYGSCNSNYTQDPSAQATFGVFAPETRKVVNVRELLN